MLYVMYRNISKIEDQNQPVNPRIHYVVLKVTSSGCLKLLELNPWELWKMKSDKKDISFYLSSEINIHDSSIHLAITV